ncbi:ankyrin repeat-containing protein [Anaeramoeba ignava]|uniref:Ankyrin repeat-containing protein n=1 Tax=Anaeramoeba ignava TaxID=1746090 RepID=A0A9Q0R436_ANAIG|nr:ankyrin repeat-containing protein [Anaeramoeba ignava]
MDFEIFSTFQKLLKENKIESIQNFLKENELTQKQISKCLTLSLINRSTPFEVIQLLIKSGANINYKTLKSRKTALLTAIRESKSSEVIDFLIKSGADLDAKDSKNRTLLFYIMRHLSPETGSLISYILEKGARINDKDNLLQTPIFYAFINKQPIDIIKLLIEKGADTNIYNFYGENLMDICAKYNPNIELFQLLIDKGVEINEKDKHFKNSLTYLLQNYPKNIPEIKFLVSKGASVGKSLFPFVMDPKYFEIIKFTLSLDSSLINEKNFLQQTLLHRACFTKNNIKTIELVIQKGINVNAEDYFGNTALHFACQNKLENETIKLLISSGVNPSIQNCYNRYALQYFHKWDYSENPERSETMILLFKGIDFTAKNMPRLSETEWKNLFNNSKNEEHNSEIIKIIDKITNLKRTPPYYSVQISIEKLLLYSYKNFGIFKFLFEKSLKSGEVNFTSVITCISHSPDSSSLIKYILETLSKHPEMNVDINTAFMSFCRSTHQLENFELFLKNGADANYKDSYQNTPLMMACHYSPSMFKIDFLIESGADVLAKDYNGNTALHHFCKSGSSSFQFVDIPNLMKIFKSKGLSIHDKNNKNEDALICTCTNFHVQDELIRYLIEDGADLNSFNDSKMCAFSLYLQNRNHSLEVIKLFIEKGVKKEIIQSSFVNWIRNSDAIRDCHPLETFKFFLENNLLENKQKIIFDNSQVLHYLIDIYSIKEDELNDLLGFFIKNGANSEVKTNRNENLLHSICSKHPSFVQLVKFLLTLNLDVNAVTNSKETPLSIICRSSNQAELIPILLSQGANPNYPQNCIDLIRKNSYLLRSNSSYREYLLWYGAEDNDQQENNYYTYIFSRLLLQTYKSYQEDFLKLFKRKELTDYKIQCKYGFILVHKLIITSRLYLENQSEKEMFQKFLNFAFETPKQEMEIIVEFLYSGIIEMNNYEKHFQLLEKFAQNLGFSKNWIIQKSGKIGLIHDLERLYQDEKSKDFTIIFPDETTIQVHKLILIARSNLFRGMFLSVVDNSNPSS